MSFKTDNAEISALMHKAIAIAGSEAKLAKACGFSQNAIWYAKRRGRVSGRMARAIESATNGAVRKHDLCPDVFEPTSDGEQASDAAEVSA